MLFARAAVSISVEMFDDWIYNFICHSNLVWLVLKVPSQHTHAFFIVEQKGHSVTALLASWYCFQLSHTLNIYSVIQWPQEFEVLSSNPTCFSGSDGKFHLFHFNLILIGFCHHSMLKNSLTLEYTGHLQKIV